jgi:BirA family biotin operon repressor/biotin-[acetyl-CoA-carboxylase] ligase
LAAVVGSFDRWNRLWLAQGFAPVRAAWRERALALGSEIRVRLETATLHGRFADIDQDGALLLDTGGELRRISAGDVFPAR